MIADEQLRAELTDERERILRFGRAARTLVGFGHLDAAGRLDLTQPVPTYQTARMVYVYALSCHLGHDDLGLVEHGVAALLDRSRDREYGGWFASVDPAGEAHDPRKAGYTHAFVLLAGAAAATLPIRGADALLGEAIDVLDRRFWSAEQGVLRESFDRGWHAEEPYRGANANMHAVEAFLALAAATADEIWLERATRIAVRFSEVARRHAWRLPEHYDEQLAPRLDYNHDRPDHPFRPFGVTPGHLLEWARLLAVLSVSRPDGGDLLMESAIALYARGVGDGWAADGRPGFVYTTDFVGRPVCHTRMHWVMAEAMSAAAVLGHRTDSAAYAADLVRWWSEVKAHYRDLRHGSWHHALTVENEPAPQVWDGKPDLYHAVQALTLPQVPQPAALLFGGLA